MAGPDGAIAVTIDTSTTFQTIRGWETSDRVWETDKKADRFDGSWISVADQLAKSLVAEVGINSLRLQIASGTENPVGNWQRFSDGTIGYKEMKSHLYETVNDNDDPALLDPAGFNFFALDQHVENVAIPMQTALAAQGERLFVTLTFVDFNWTDGATRLDFAKYPAEYAEFIFAAFQHLDQKYGLVPDALEVILEPENTDFWRGRTIGNAIVAATGRLAAAGYHPLIIAPSTKAAENAVDYYRDIRATLAGRAKIDVLAYHRYGSRTSAALPGIAAAAKATGVQTAMLEYTDGGVDDLLEDLVVGNVSAWQQYGVARKVVNGEPRASASYYLDALFDGDTMTITLPKRTRLLAEVFRAIRQGATRIAATSASNAVLPVAARSPDGDIATVLRLYSPASVLLRGLPAGRYVLSGTDEDGNAVAAMPVEIAAFTPFQTPDLPAGVISLRPAP